MKMDTNMHTTSKQSCRHKWYETAEQLANQAKEQIRAKSSTKGLSGVPSGFERMDYLTSGWQAGNLIVVAAREGMGSLGFSISMTHHNLVEKDIAVGFFSLEKSPLQLISRLLAMETKLSTEKLRTGILTKEEFNLLHSKVDELTQKPLYVSGEIPNSIKEMHKQIKGFVQKGVKILFIDRLQLLEFNELSIEKESVQKMEFLLRELKQLAVAFQVPIIVISETECSQKFQELTDRPSFSKILLHHVFQKTTDVVLLLYRPEYFRIEEWDDDSGTATSNTAEAMIVWNRSGGLGNIRLKFVGYLGKFENLDKT